MKAKEAPEKLYISYVGYGVFGEDCSTERTNNSQTEYTRTDAFIEKACEWLKNNTRKYAFVDTDRIGNVADIDLLLVQNFKNYMKGE